ncbi:MAG: mono/diheme cytochrome c family protein, partial [Myxococcota bacterium]
MTSDFQELAAPSNTRTTDGTQEQVFPRPLIRQALDPWVHEPFELETQRTALTRNLAATIATVALTVLSLAFASASFAEDNARGKVLFDLCKQCHGPAGGGMTLSLAPAIAGMDEWYVDRQLKNFKSGIRGLHADDLGGLR